MRTYLTGRRGGQRGQAMVELAVGLPLLLMVVFAAVDFGRAYSIHVTLSDAVREGARYGIANPADATGISNAVKDAAGPYNDTNLTVSSSTASTSQSSASGAPSCASGEYLTVSANYSLSLITPLAGIVKLISATTNVTSAWTLQPQAKMCVQ